MDGRSSHERRRSRARLLAAGSFWLALSPAGLWGVSRFGDWSTGHLLVPRRFDVSVSAGELVLCDDPYNLEIVDLLEAGKRMWPAPVAGRACTLPGVKYRAYSFADQRTTWSLRVSFVAPAAVFGAVGLACMWRVRRIGAESQRVALVLEPGRRSRKRR